MTVRQHLSANLSPAMPPFHHHPLKVVPNRASYNQPAPILSVSDPPPNPPGFGGPLSRTAALPHPPALYSASPPPTCFPRAPLFPPRRHDPTLPSPLAHFHFPAAAPGGCLPPSASPPPRPRTGSPGAPHQRRRSRSFSPPGRSRLPGSRRRERRARPRRTTRRRTEIEWPPTAPWQREQGRERGDERCGAGEREGREDNPAAGSTKPLPSSCSEDRLGQTDSVERSERAGARTRRRTTGLRAGSGGGRWPR